MSNTKPFFHRLVSCHHAAVLTLLATALAGCASLSGGSDPATAVHKRAQQRWTALVAGQFDKAYPYLAPSVREVMSYDHFRSSFGSGGAWQAADVYDVKCELERCEAKIRLRIKLPIHGIESITTDTQETWIPENGQWWLYQKP